MAISGGPAKTLAEAAEPRGGTWGAPVDGGPETIVFTPRYGGGLWIVPVQGGAPRPLTSLDAAARERSHRWPSFLPDGRHIVYSAQREGGNYEDGSIQIVDIRDGTVSPLGIEGAYARVAPSGHLLWVRGGALQAAAFDLEARKVVGAPVRVVDGLMSLTQDQAMDDGTAQYAFSDDGRAIYRVGASAMRRSRPAWYDRGGHEISRNARAENFSNPRISPDGERVALVVSQPSGGDDIWIWDPARDAMDRLTFSEAWAQLPIWSPDGERISFVSNPFGRTRAELSPDVGLSVHVKAADGSGEEVPFIDSPVPVETWSISPDGRTLFAQQMTAAGTWDLVTFEVGAAEASQADPLVTSPGSDLFPMVSPDGHWLVYESTESETRQIIVRSISDGGGQWQLGSGFFPSWTRGGREIVFLRGSDQVARVSVDASSGAPRFGPVEVLFTATFVATRPPFDVTTDGERFLLLLAEDDEADGAVDSVVLATDFFDQLRALAPRSSQ